MREMTMDQMFSECRLALDGGKDLSGPLVRDLREANERCLFDLDVAIRRAQSDESGPGLILRA